MLRRNLIEANMELTISCIKHLLLSLDDIFVDVDDLIALKNDKYVPDSMSRKVNKLIREGIEINKTLNDYQRSVSSINEELFHSQLIQGRSKHVYAET